MINTNGSATGWQTKYVFNIGGLLKQAQLSLEAALSIHADLTCYVVCFPFDLTGKTGRKGKSQTEKFDEWVSKAEANAKIRGRAMTIERRSAHEIQDLILANDSSGGLRHYFFSATTFSDDWFAKHVAAAKLSVGPRYNREISLETPLSKWFSSFGEGSVWQKQLVDYLDACTADLLIEDGPSTDAIGAENVVRPAFERFGDFLVASEMLEPLTSSNVYQAFRSGGQFVRLLGTMQVIRENAGLLSALSVLVPEMIPGMELTDLVENDSVRAEVAAVVVRSLPWRTAERSCYQRGTC